METVEGSKSLMKERWEKRVEHEIAFILNVEQYEADLKDMIEENEQDYSIPVTHYREDIGWGSISCISVENQAIQRIEKREALKASLERLYERRNRFMRVFNSLDEDDHDLIDLTYFSQGFDDESIGRILGIRKTVVKKVREKVLKKMLELFEIERTDRINEWVSLSKVQLRENSAILREQYEAEVKRSRDHRLFVEEMKEKVRQQNIS